MFRLDSLIETFYYRYKYLEILSNAEGSIGTRPSILFHTLHDELAYDGHSNGVPERHELTVYSMYHSFKIVALSRVRRAEQV